MSEDGNELSLSGGVFSLDGSEAIILGDSVKLSKDATSSKR